MSKPLHNTALPSNISLTRAPTHIHGDSELSSSALVSGGSGTSMDPYVIQGLEFGDISGNGLTIANTTLALEIRDIKVWNVSGFSIYLKNVSNCVIDGTFMDVVGGGLYAVGCANLTLNDMEIRNFTDAGISIDTCKHISIHSPVIQRGSVGIALVNTVGLRIEGGAIGWNSNVGVKVTTMSDVSITGTNLPYNDLHSIQIINSGGIYIGGIDVRGSYRDGLSITDSSAITITDVQVQECGRGISLKDSSGFLLKNNTLIYNEETGLVMDSSHNGTVMDNIDLGNEVGYIIVGCKNVMILNNTLDHDGLGMDIESSRYMEVVGNVLTGCGLYLMGYEMEDYTTNSLINNTADERPVIFIKNEHNVSVSNSPTAQIIIANSTDVNIEKIEMESVNYGISAAFSTDISLNSIIVRNMDIVGVEIYKCTKVYISHSEFSFNLQDITLYGSSNVIVKENEFNSTASRAIIIGDGCIDVLIHHNNIVSGVNVSLGWSDAEDCSWNDTDGGNYWSNYALRYNTTNETGNVWSVPYAIEGNGGNMDYMPLRTPVEGAGVPNSTFQLDVTVRCPGNGEVDITIYREGTVVTTDTINGTGVYYLKPGSYVINAKAQGCLPTVESFIGRAFDIVVLNLELIPEPPKNSTLRVSVVDKANNPIPKAAISYEGSDNVLGFTGADGTLTLDLPPGNYTLNVKKEGYHPATIVIRLEAGGEYNTSATLESVRYVLILSVVYGDGTGVEDAELDVYDPYGNHVGNATVKDGSAEVYFKYRPLTGYIYTVKIRGADVDETAEYLLIVEGVDDFNGIVTTDKMIITVTRPTHSVGDGGSGRTTVTLMLLVVLLIFLAIIVYVSRARAQGPRKENGGDMNEAQGANRERGKGRNLRGG